MNIDFFKTDNGTIISPNMGNVENVGFKNYIINFHALSIYPMLCTQDGFCGDLLWDVAYRLATKDFESMAWLDLPDALTSILDKELNKREQVKLLKDCELTPPLLCALFAQAEGKGYKFSHYRFEGVPSGVDRKKLPKFIHVREDNIVEHVGKTSLSDKQLRQVVSQSDVLIARILDNGNHWHCFLQTYKGLKGEEKGLQGTTPHIHYLSDAFGITRADLVKKLEKGKYPTTPVHIPLREYRDSR